MKRLILLVLAVMLTGSLMFAGGGSASGGSGSGPKDQITCWTNERHDMAYIFELVEAYNRTNKDNVEFEYIIHADVLPTLLTMAASSGQLPDMFTNSSGNLGTTLQAHVDAKMMAPIDRFITPAFRESAGLDNVLFEGYNMLDGKIYWIPMALRSGVRLVYNKELFAKAGIQNTPKTIAELVDYAKRITAVGEGKAYGYAAPMNGFNRLFTHSANLSGIHYYDYRNGKFEFSAYKPFVQAFKQIVDDGSILPGYSSLQIDPLRVQFSEGNIGMHANASQEIGVLSTQFPAKIEWGIAPLPTLDGTVKGAQTATYMKGYPITPASKKPEKAWAVINYFYEVENVLGYHERGLDFPVFKFAIGHPRVTAVEIQGWKEYMPQNESLFPILPAFDIEGKLWDGAFWDACMPGGPSIDATIAELNQRYNDSYDRAIRAGRIQRLIIRDYDPMRPSAGKIEYARQ